jgi:hypothetical protein
MSRKKLFTFLCLFTIAAVISMIFSSCATDGPEGWGNRILRITLKVPDNTYIDTTGRGYYAVLFNNFAEQIQVTDYETFTDFIRYDGFNFTWFHRQGNVPAPGYTWVAAGNLNATSSVSSDGTSLIIRIDLSDSANLFNQFITTQRFTMHALTTDSNNQLLGRVIDTIGQGPSVEANSLYTVKFDVLTGILSPPPPNYPWDPIGDWDEKPDMPGFPYQNYDIEMFSVELED